MKLWSFERRWLLAIFDTVLPLSLLLEQRASSVPRERFIDELLAHAPPHFTLGLRACTWLVTWAPPLVLGRCRRFESLSPEERAELFAVLARSDIYLVRELPLLFKMVACLGYCGLPSVQRSVGIPAHGVGPAWARSGLRLVATPAEREVP